MVGAATPTSSHEEEEEGEEVPTEGRILAEEEEEEIRVVVKEPSPRRTEKENEEPPPEELLAEEEILERPLPFEDYAKETNELREHIRKLEKEYKEREKVIDRILEYGTGIETAEALRMYPTPTLRKWEAALESYRKAQIENR